METDDINQSTDVLRSARIADFAGRDAVYFIAGTGLKPREFVLTLDALEAIEDSALPSRHDMKLSFDKNNKRISEKVLNVLSVGGQAGNPIVLQASDFPRV